MRRGRPPRRDWIGYWMSLVEERGESMAIRYGRVATPPVAGVASGASEGVQWQWRPHARFDGLGGLAGGLGLLADEDLPEARGLVVGGRGRRLAALARCLVARPGRPATWRGHDGGWRAVAGQAERARPAADAVAFGLLGVEETAALVEGARRAGVSVNSLLLWALGRAVAPELVPGSGQPVWFVPVSLRGLVRQRELHANHISFCYVRAGDEPNPGPVHAAIRAQLDRAVPWGHWLMSNLGQVIGARGVRLIARAQARTGASSIGTFSNLGALRGRDDDAAWLFCPPVTRTQPLGAGVLTWNGRLGLTVQLHPALPRPPSEVVALMERWLVTATSAVGVAAPGRRLQAR